MSWVALFALALLLPGSTWLGFVLNLRTGLLSLKNTSVLKYLAKVAATVVECRYTDSHEAA